MDVKFNLDKLTTIIGMLAANKYKKTIAECEETAKRILSYFRALDEKIGYLSLEVEQMRWHWVEQGDLPHIDVNASDLLLIETFANEYVIGRYIHTVTGKNNNPKRYFLTNVGAAIYETDDVIRWKYI